MNPRGRGLAHTCSTAQRKGADRNKRERFFFTYRRSEGESGFSPSLRGDHNDIKCGAKCMVDPICTLVRTQTQRMKVLRPGSKMSPLWAATTRAFARKANRRMSASPRAKRRPVCSGQKLKYKKAATREIGGREDTATYPRKQTEMMRSHAQRRRKRGPKHTHTFKVRRHRSKVERPRGDAAPGAVAR